MCLISKLYLFKVLLQRETNSKCIRKGGIKTGEKKTPFLGEGWTLEMAEWYVQAEGPEQIFQSPCVIAYSTGATNKNHVLQSDKARIKSSITSQRVSFGSTGTTTCLLGAQGILIEAKRRRTEDPGR